MRNRSVPVDTVLPHLVYQNVPEAIEWLTRVFGFKEHYRYGDPASGAQICFGNVYFMLRNVGLGGATPTQLGHRTQSLTVFVENVDEHFRRAKSAGARIVEDLNETIYGERQFAVEDLDGHRWLFAQHARDVSPDEWGAKIAGR